MAKAKKTTAKAGGTKPIADVAHPDTTAPSDTSKPIINQRPIMKDPMMVGSGSGDEKPKDKKPLPLKTAETKIAPPKESAEESAEEPAGEPEAEPAAEDDKPETAEKPEKAEDKPEEKTDEAEADKKPSSKPKADTEPAVKTAQDAKIEQLIESKKYALPINAVEHRRSKRVVIVGIILALVLIVAWVDIALDASLIDISGVKPVTHFFSN